MLFRSIKNPIFGVGLDSYGDWYRQMRGEISTLRGSPERTSNTAHNIFIDLGASGGVPLITSFIIIIILALVAARKAFKEMKTYDPYLVAVFASWVGFIIQANVSINNIGVGVWGWIFTGLLIAFGYGNHLPTNGEDDLSDSKRITNIKGRKRKSTVPMVLPPKTALFSFAGGALGFSLLFLPLKVDAEFRAADAKKDLAQMRSASSQLGGTAFHKELTLDLAVRNNLIVEAVEISDGIIEEYPRDFFAWKIRALSNPQGSPLRLEAVSRLKEMDPFNNELPLS